MNQFENMEFYTRNESGENAFEIYNPIGEQITNHNGRPYPLLSDQCSKILLADINQICKQYYKSNYTKDENDETVFNIVLASISGEELRVSFAYCLISTLMEYASNDAEMELDVEQLIQWDRLFRLNIEENGGDIELTATSNSRSYFKDKWKNYGLNYSDSIEQMAENEVEMVSDEVVKEVVKLTSTLHISQKAAVNILYHFFENFSITIPILWACEIISNKDLVASNWALQYGVDIESFDEEQMKEPLYLIERLQALKLILEYYQMKDQSLPCVNY
jgi:hypothetical protein